MKITDVRSFVVDATATYGRPRRRHWVFVHVHTDEGITGVGEASNWPGELVVETAVRDLKRHVVGQDPFNVESLWQRMYFGSYPYGIGGAVISGMSGIEVACWDIIGKALKVPVWKLLGGTCHEKIRLYGHAGSPEGARELVDEGYTAVKTSPSPEIVRSIREAVGENVEIAVDRGGYRDQAAIVKVARQLERYNLLFFEVNPENINSLAQLKAEVKVPLATGETLYTRHGFREVFERQAAHIIQPDVVRTGGILETKKIAAIAETYYMPVAPHNPNGPVATMASVHLAASLPNFQILEYVAEDVPWREEVATPIEVKRGFIELPTKPGLGIELDEEEVAKHPYKELANG
ncbi:MAG: mandelate racemase/muconate lactonizing enzyme family protein [Candidatus Bathyarchaeia archaeon]